MKSVKMRFVMSILALCSSLCAASASAGIVYVKTGAVGANNGTNWSDAYSDLQSALNVAQSGDEIWVAVGTYKPTAMTNPPDPRSATFSLVNGVTLYGGFRGLPSDEGVNDATTRPGDPVPATPAPATDSILSGDVNGDDGPNFANYADNVYHVMSGGTVDGTAILDGFTIIGGNASSGAIRGGGLDGGSPTVRACAFLYNKAQIAGGGLNGGATLIACLFAGNAAPDGGGAKCGSQSVSNCRFEANSATVGLLGGGGLLAYGTKVVNCTFSRNQSAGDGSAATFFNDGTQLINSVVSMHSGNAIRIHDYSGSVVNCIFFKNDVAISIGDVCSIGPPNCGQANVFNTIIWAKNTGTIVNAGSPPAIITVTNCCIEGWDGSLGGTGNFGDDPRFVDADGPDNIPGNIDDNLRLLSISPCIDRGSNSLIPSGVIIDLDGNPRIYDFPGAPGAGVDIGAYEFQADSPDVCNGTLCPGDLNGDHAINALDIQALVDALLSGMDCP